LKAPEILNTVADGKSRHLAYDRGALPDAEARRRAFFATYRNDRRGSHSIGPDQRPEASSMED